MTYFRWRQRKTPPKNSSLTWLKGRRTLRGTSWRHRSYAVIKLDRNRKQGPETERFSSLKIKAQERNSSDDGESNITNRKDSGGERKCSNTTLLKYWLKLTKKKKRNRVFFYLFWKHVHRKSCSYWRKLLWGSRRSEETSPSPSCSVKSSNFSPRQLADTKTTKARQPASKMAQENIFFFVPNLIGEIFPPPLAPR